ncbi:MAG TPA: hypothetical protein V6D20_16440 [Candidatus Obscuribacterales bacterium]
MPANPTGFRISPVVDHLYGFVWEGVDIVVNYTGQYRFELYEYGRRDFDVM